MIKGAGQEGLRLVGNFFVWIGDFFKAVFLGIHLSIRRKITFDFLTLYVILSTISIVVVSLLFTYYNVDNISYEINDNINKLLLAYDRGQYDLGDLQARLESLSQGDEIQLAVDIKAASQVDHIQTSMFITGKFPKNFYQKLYCLVRYNYIAKEPSTYNFRSTGVGKNDYVIYQLHSFSKHSRYTAVLVWLMLMSVSITFFFLSTIGGNRIKSVLNPIYQMTKTAAQISGENLEERIDISSTKYELRDLAITMNDMLDRLNRDYDRQKQFVSDVSHELRTPIAIINGYGNMVKRWGKADEKILQEALAAIIDEAGNMQHLVENLLTLARSDNQTLSFEYEIFNLSMLVDQIANQAKLVDVKEQAISCEIEPNLWCNLDFAKIKQVLRIFMDNAIKYTDRGKEITVFCYSDDTYIYAGVRDRGIGVDKEELARLFQRFYRLDESRARETGGHGLGLAIAKALVIGQGGRIRARSKKGHGSEFAMFFPKNKYWIENDPQEE